MSNILLPEEYAALEASPHRPMHVLQVRVWINLETMCVYNEHFLGCLNWEESKQTRSGAKDGILFPQVFHWDISLG